MPDTDIRTGSLVLYKSGPALVRGTGDKLEIVLPGGKAQRVRRKDVTLLHPGPLGGLSELTPQSGEVEEVWELLDGAETTLAELADLVYGDYRPATAWAAWQLVGEGLYFHGVPGGPIHSRSAEEVARLRAEREVREAEEAAWAACLERLGKDRYAPEDERYLREVVEQAYDRKAMSPVLKALGKEQSPQNAHALLLRIGYWDQWVDPHPARIGAAVRSSPAEVGELPEEARVDLTHLDSLAIDDVGNQDPDDALALDGERLWVHVADAAALVPPDSPADLEARARGATLYLPEGIATMLPEPVTHRLGLGLAEVSPALSFGLDLDADGRVTRLEVVPSWIRARRLTYEAVESRLHEAPFDRLLRLAEAAQARRAANGAVRLAFPEVSLQVAERQVSIRPLPPLRARMLVSEAMLMAGEAAARYAVEHAIPFPFTTQELGEDLADRAPQSLSAMYTVRRAMKPRQQRIAPGPHKGLGLDLYAQATSPLRRYLDLVVHQQLRAHATGRPLLDEQALLERVGAAEAVTGSIRKAERLARQHWTVVWLGQHKEWKGEGVLVDKREKRGRVIIGELGTEANVALPGELALDSVLPLRLAGTDLPALEAYFAVDKKRL
jgi:exoribonuclease-2